MEPINYLPAQQNSPLQSLASGLQVGAGFQQLQQQQLEMEKAQAAAQRTAQFRSEVGPALQAGDPAALVQLFGKYPDFGDQIKQASGFLNDADENNKKTTSATVYNGLQSGNVDIAKKALESRVNYLTKIGADANEWKGALDALNSGDPDKIKQVQQQATFLHALYNPTAIKTMNDVNTDRRAEQLQPAKVREGVASADKAASDATTAATTAKFAPQVAQLGIEKAGKEIQDIGSRISERGARLSLDRDRLNADIKTAADNLAVKYADAKRAGNDLPGDVRKLVTENTMSASASKTEANSMKDLASRIETSNLKGGILGSASEILKKATGSQDYNTELRKEYARIRSQGVIKALPPGPATDRDIEQASKGFLEENASPKTIASFLRGMAKIRDVESQMQQITADFAEQNRGVGRARSDIQIGQYTAKKGDSLADVYKQIKVAEQPAPAKPAAKGAPASPKNITVDY